MLTKEAVLFYHPDPILAAKAGKVFQGLGVSAGTVGPRQMGQAVGFLLGMEGHAGDPAAPALPMPGEPLLIMSGFTRPRMDLLLSALREGGIPPIPLKAVATPTNVAWTLGALCAELRREHAQLHGGK